MTFQEKINELRSNIERQLTPLIDNDYVLYDLPYHNNIGDLLIWEGELEFLKQIPFVQKDMCSKETYRKSKKKIASSTVILLHGGGNFGDTWRDTQKFRLKIVQEYPENKIIIFPQTVFYEDESLMKADAEIMGKHKNLIICARDKVSYNLLENNFTNQILLVPDMAFCIPPESLKKYQLPLVDKTLFLKRKDKELKNQKYEIHPQYPLTVSDWVTFEHQDLIQIGLLATSLLCKLGMPSLKDWYGMNIYRSRLIKKGVRFISPYKEIYTTRLHVAILSVFLNKPFVVLDNSYGKNKAFFDTWLFDVEDVAFDESGKQVVDF